MHRMVCSAPRARRCPSGAHHLENAGEGAGRTRTQEVPKKGLLLEKREAEKLVTGPGCSESKRIPGSPLPGTTWGSRDDRAQCPRVAPGAAWAGSWQLRAVELDPSCIVHLLPSWLLPHPLPCQFRLWGPHCPACSPWGQLGLLPVFVRVGSPAWEADSP